MATFTATRATSTFPAFQQVGAGLQGRAWGTIEVTANPAPSDIFKMCKLPKGAVITGGRLFSERLASGATLASTALGWNVGVDAAFTTPDGTSYGATTASNALGTMGAIDYTAVTVGSIKPESGCNLPLGGLLYTQGPLTMTTKGNVIVTATTSATSFVTGTLSLLVDFVTP